MKVYKYLISFATLMIFALGGFSQDLVYKAKNPAFGGDTFNYQWLQSSADAQNQFQGDDFDFGDESELDQFQENLNRQLLNEISRSLFNDQFGEGGLQEGQFTFGSLSVDIFPSSEGLAINILDILTGEQTQVIVPFP